MRERASWFVFSNTRRNNCRLPVAGSQGATEVAMLAVHLATSQASPPEKQILRCGNPGSGEFVCFLEYVSIPLSLAGSGFTGRYEGRDANRSSNEKSYIATIKHQTIGVGMRGRGKFVRFLEYVSIPLSLAGSGFGVRQAARDASHSSKEMLGIATEKHKTPTMAMPDRGPFLYLDN